MRPRGLRRDELEFTQLRRCHFQSRLDALYLDNGKPRGILRLDVGRARGPHPTVRANVTADRAFDFLAASEIAALSEAPMPAGARSSSVLAETQVAKFGRSGFAANRQAG